MKIDFLKTDCEGGEYEHFIEYYNEVIIHIDNR